jgi:hypothetical protein
LLQDSAALVAKLFFAELQPLSGFLHERWIERCRSVAVFDALWIEALVEAGDHAFDTEWSRQGQAVDGFILFGVSVVGAFDNHRIFLPGQFDDRLEASLLE